MALHHARSGEKIPLQRSDDDIAYFTPVALAKTAQMELIRLVLPKGRVISEHQVEGELSLVCLEGEILVRTAAETVALAPSEMLWLAARTRYALEATADAVGLLTILLQRPPPN